MPKLIIPLTDTKINKSKPKDKPYKLFDGGGLYLEVYPTGSKLWRVKYNFLKKEKRLSLGAYPTITLLKAREKREEIKQLLSDNIDPSTYKKTENNFTTISTIIDEWIEIKKPRWAISSFERINQINNKHIKPTIGNYHVAKVTRPVVVDLIKSIEAKNSYNTSKKTRHLLNQAFKYAMVKGLIDINPASDLSIISSEPVIKKNYNSVSFADLPKLLKDVQESNSNAVTKAYIFLLALTALRPSELRLAKWSEINHDLLNIPADRMKKRRLHITPLSSKAIYVLEQIKPITGDYDFIFSSNSYPNQPIARSTTSFIMKSAGYSDKHTPHGFRHLLSTELNNRGYNHDWIEKQLAHGDTDKIRGTYNHASYLDQRRKMMQEWADSIDFDFKLN